MLDMAQKTMLTDAYLYEERLPHDEVKQSRKKLVVGHRPCGVPVRVSFSAFTVSSVFMALAKTLLSKSALVVTGRLSAYIFLMCFSRFLARLML